MYVLVKSRRNERQVIDWAPSLTTAMVLMESWSRKLGSAWEVVVLRQ